MDKEVGEEKEAGEGRAGEGVRRREEVGVWQEKEEEEEGGEEGGEVGGEGGWGWEGEVGG